MRLGGYRTGIALAGGLALAACQPDIGWWPAEQTVAVTPSTSSPVQAVVGASRALSLTFNSRRLSPASDLTITTGLAPLPSGWSGPQSFQCTRVAIGSGCQLALSYAPAATDSGTLTLQYSYTASGGTQRHGTFSMPYQSTAGDNVVATASVSGQLVAVAGGTPLAVGVTFDTDDGNVATDLAVTTDLSALPPGWSSASGSFGCATVSTGRACQLELSYAPQTPGDGTLVLQFGYRNDLGAVGTGSLDIAYSALGSYSVGGTVVGLDGSVTLQDDGGDDLVLSSDGTFSFGTEVPAGSPYQVTVSAQPTGQTCSVLNGSGSVATAAVTDVVVNCTDNTYSIGGSISGLSGGGLVLTDNGGDTLPVAPGAAAFTFATPLSYGSDYVVGIDVQPTGQSCTVRNASGTVTGTVQSVTVSCTTLSYNVGGTVSGLTGSGLALANGSDIVHVTAPGGGFDFPMPVLYGSPYAVTIQTQPTGQLCQVTANASGTVIGPISNIEVSCAYVEWTWMSGGEVANISGSYGTQKDAAVGNLPGARQWAGAWQDKSGNLWLFGGNGRATAGPGYLNDLWQYSPASGLWTWVAGSNSLGATGVYGTEGTAAPGNTPGARDCATAMTDASGKFWLFGGYGSAVSSGAGYLNDLWSYDPSSGEWTWVSGANSTGTGGTYGTKGTGASTNVPGARCGASSWADSSGNLWLFGGYGYPSPGYTTGYLNDLWEYSAKLGEWIWISGAKSSNATGTYGTQGKGATANVPGGREGAVTWIDSGGNLWLFGGYVVSGASGNMSLFNDLWEYQVNTGYWVWVSGSSTTGASGVYGTLGTAATSNVPGARWAASTWIDAAGNLWLFGGTGIDSTGATGQLNDLWEFVHGSSNTWTWISGADTAGAAGVYGTQKVTAIGSVPGARSEALSWIDASGNLWLFGGTGDDSEGYAGELNDLWRATLP